MKKLYMNIAINGFGRIGKTFLRSLLTDTAAREKIKVAAINVGPDDITLSAHLFKYDSLMGTYPGVVEIIDKKLVIDGIPIHLCNETDPEKLPWKEHHVDWVVECSGKFSSKNGALKHIKAGAHKVLISAPAQDEDATLIMGVNDHDYTDAMRIVSLGSCTTNALVPVLKVLDDQCGIEKAFMTTIHAYTNTQVLLDVGTFDARRSRAAALNIVPTSSGATSTLKKVLPHLADKVDGCALRVPIAKVSLIDLTFHMTHACTAPQIHDAFSQAASTRLKGILDITHQPLVSSDFSGSNYSVVIDGLMTQTMGTLGKVFGWYDNEWAYSQRMKDFLMNIGTK
jgi:glyceraldehyde 3-phosphate dehydrogenase